MTDGLLPKRITLADIARRLDVSSATVSLALRNHPQISKPRRDQINLTALEMGYRPDPMLSALNRYRHDAPPVHSALGWINRWQRPAALRELHEFDEYWHGAVEMAGLRGYHLEEIVWSEQLSSARLKTILGTRDIRGVVIPPAERSGLCTTGLSWDSFPWGDFSAVRLGRSIATPGFPVVTSDQVYNCRLAFAEIRRRGYTRIGFVTSEHMVAFTLASAGFLMAQSALPVARHVRPLVLKTSDDTGAQKTFQNWLKKIRPDAILTDLHAVHGWLKQSGYRVPEDIVLAALSILDGDATAGIDQQSREIGRAAIEVLITHLDRHVQGVPNVSREMLIQGRWTENITLPWRCG